jgi:hypothetical protein
MIASILDIQMQIKLEGKWTLAMPIQRGAPIMFIIGNTFLEP